MKYGFLFGAGAEAAYGLPSGRVMGSGTRNPG